MFSLDRSLSPSTLAIVVALGSLVPCRKPRGGAGTNPRRTADGAAGDTAADLRGRPKPDGRSVRWHALDHGPTDWRIAPDSQPLELAAAAEKRLAFNIEKARNVAANVYPFTIQARVGDRLVRCEQSVFVATPPYSKATIDGRPDEWQDAIPVSFVQQDKRTTISTFWQRKRSACWSRSRSSSTSAMRVRTDRRAMRSSWRSRPGTARSRRRADRPTLRVPVDVGGRRRQVFSTGRLGHAASGAGRRKALEPLECSDVETAIVRDGEVTYYECSLPFSLLREAIEPAEGREFFLSVLVHDPDGTGLRDLGRAAGLWPQPDDAQAWSRWRGMAAPLEPPLGNQVRWGLCTSKY